MSSLLIDIVKAKLITELQSEFLLASLHNTWMYPSVSINPWYLTFEVFSNLYL